MAKLYHYSRAVENSWTLILWAKRGMVCKERGGVESMVTSWAERQEVKGVARALLTRLKEKRRDKVVGSMKVMILRYGEDYVAPRRIERAARESYFGRRDYVYSKWMCRPGVSLSPNDLRGAARIVYRTCRHLGCKITFVPFWEDYGCWAEYHDRELSFRMVVSWKPLG